MEYLQGRDKRALRFAPDSLAKVTPFYTKSCCPNLINFDDPTAAPDMTAQIEVRAAIRTIFDESHTAAIYVALNLAVVAQLLEPSTARASDHNCARGSGLS
jgi:ABC-type phosphonate transport system ATPase subunit